MWKFGLVLSLDRGRFCLAFYSEWVVLVVDIIYFWIMLFWGGEVVDKLFFFRKGKGSRILNSIGLFVFSFVYFDFFYFLGV